MQKTIISIAITGLFLSTAIYAAETVGQAAHATAPAVAAAAHELKPAAVTANNAAMSPDTQLREKFQALDKNHDGSIDKKEARADKDLHKSFKKIAKKGRLDETGYINWQQAQKPRS